MPNLIDNLLLALIAFILPVFNTWFWLSFYFCAIVCLFMVVWDVKKSKQPGYKKINITYLFACISAIPLGLGFGVIFADLFDPINSLAKLNIFLVNLFLWPIAIMIIFYFSREYGRKARKEYIENLNEQNNEPG